MRSLVLVVAFQTAGMEMAAAAPADGATVRWYGQACFEIVSQSVVRVVVDPFGAQVGYPVPSLTADVVLITHEHGDHNNAGAVKGSPEVLHGLKLDGKGRTVRGVEVRAVRTDHDASGGKERGQNTPFVLKMGGL